MHAPSTDTTRKPNAFGFRMVESRSNSEWFGFRRPFENGPIRSVFEWSQNPFDSFRVGRFIYKIFYFLYIKWSSLVRPSENGPIRSVFEPSKYGSKTELLKVRFSSGVWYSLFGFRVAPVFVYSDPYCNLQKSKLPALLI